MIRLRLLAAMLLVSLTVKAQYPVSWKNRTGLTTTTSNDLLKTAPDGWGNAGAFSVNTGVTGWVDYTATVPSPQFAFGLSDQDVNTEYTSIDYGFIIRPGNHFDIVESGVIRQSGTFSSGDVLRVEKTLLNLVYRKNGTEIRAAALTLSLGVTLHADLSVYTSQELVSGISTSWMAPLQADAGADKYILTGESVRIGGSPSARGGKAPYTYSWMPSTALSSPTESNPVASPSSTAMYSLLITDANGMMSGDTVTVNVAPPVRADAGRDTMVGRGGSARLGGNPPATGGFPPYTYSWGPSAGLSSASVANPTALPLSTSLYVLTVTDGQGNEDSDTIDVGVDTAIVRVVTVGNGTQSTDQYPFNGNSEFSWADAIYLKEELGAAGQLKSISFFVANNPVNYVMDNQRILIRHTNATSAATEFPNTSEFFIAYDGPIQYNGGGWKQVVFTTPFNYNGVDNIEFLFINNDGSPGAGTPRFRYSEAYSSQLRTNFGDIGLPCNEGCGPFRNVTDVQVGVDIDRCVITTGVIRNNPAEIDCITDARVLTLDGHDSNVALQWQSSTDGVNFKNIEDATGPVFTTPRGIEIPTQYRVAESRTLPGCTKYTEPVVVGPTASTPDGVITVTGDDGNRCTGDELTLTLTGNTGTFSKWEQSYDGITYTDVPGGTTNPVTVRVNTTTRFRAVVLKSTCKKYSRVYTHAVATNYYVNDTETSGDVFCTASGDAANNGLSPATPKTSVQDILDTYNVQPCDTIYVDSGTHDGRIVFTADDEGGTEGFVVVYGAGPGTSRLTGTPDQYDVHLLNASYIRFENLSIESVPLLRSSVQRYNVFIDRGHNNEILNCALANEFGSNVLIYGESTATTHADNNGIYQSALKNGGVGAKCIEVAGDCDNISIHNNSMRANGEDITYGIFVETNYAPQNLLAQTGLSIQGNRIEAGAAGIFIHGAGRYIDKSVISDNRIRVSSANGGESSCILLFNSGSNNTEHTLIERNFLYGGKLGIYVNDNANYIRIINNWFSGNYYGFYKAEPGATVLTRSNLLLNLNTAVTPELSLTHAPSLGEIMVTATPGSTTPAIPTHLVLFNSFYNYGHCMASADGRVGGWDLRNNIFQIAASEGEFSCIAVPSASTPFLACDFNLYYAPSANIAQWGNSFYPTLGRWQSVKHSSEPQNGDFNSLQGDPQYVDPFNNNLDLQWTSPAIGKGTSAYSVSSDIYLSFRNTPPTIGATEKTVVRVNAGPDRYICSGGAVQLNATGGNGYAWSPAAGLSATNIPNPLASPTVTTTYTVTSAGGTSSDQVVVFVENFSVSAGAAQTMCFGSSVVLNGATNAPVYSWSPAAGLSCTDCLSPIASPSVTTTYTFTASGSNGCSGSATAVVTVRATPSVTAGSSKQTLCGNETVTLSATGTGTFSWSPAGTLSNAGISNPSATPGVSTEYTVTLTDNNGCTASSAVEIMVNEIPLYSGSQTFTICRGQSLDLNGGTNAASYSWSPSAGLSRTLTPYPVASPTATTTYTVVASNGSCTASKSFVVNVNPPPSAIFTYTYPGLQVTFTPVGTTPNETYSWNFGDNTPLSTVRSPVHTFTQPGTYRVCFTITNECGREVHCENVIVRDVIAPCCTQN
jgi:hypothetical protein